MATTLSPGEQQALSMFRERVRAVAGDNLLRIVLFGSRARGEGHENSDLDLLVVVRRYDEAERRQVLDIAADIDDDTGMTLSPIVMDEARLARSFPLRDAVVRDGVTL